nr:hypothetical protein [Desulfobacula sp.]
MQILLVGPEKNSFKNLESSFSENKTPTRWLDTAEKALKLIAGEKIDLVIIHEQLPDMTAKKLVENIITLNAMMNCVVLSALPKEDFHETFEGLGVLMQFPLMPGKEDMEKLRDHLARIRRISDQIKPIKGAGNK